MQEIKATLYIPVLVLSSYVSLQQSVMAVMSQYPICRSKRETYAYSIVDWRRGVKSDCELCCTLSVMVPCVNSSQDLKLLYIHAE
ncbi:hypothetical protein LOAG_12258 [Loa loa]|uniref:Uncharacterized protein n=1 Tax=Loa loa TaxID=7209 RepID=A0A1S0TLM1_LOALO|nr:hypothetical protein LOAG_12258 [Loa loa]EFO16246.2 hypothetical protein LOAG_12258 [Loa loa]